MTCKDCIHDCVCPVWDYRKDEFISRDANTCKNFKSKDDVIKVRCKDCKFSSVAKQATRLDLYCNGYEVRICDRDKKIVSCTNFCSYGERKESE